jgi:hypothetical protein
MEEEIELEEVGESYIVIDENMRLLMTTRNFQLQKKIVAKSDTENQKAGDVSWSSFNWFTSLDSAFKTIIRIKVSKHNFNDLQGLVEANTKVINELKQAFLPDYVITKA